MSQMDQFNREFVLEFLKLSHVDRLNISIRSGLWNEKLRTLSDYDFTYYVMRRAIKERKIDRLRKAIKFCQAENLMSF